MECMAAIAQIINSLCQATSPKHHLKLDYYVLLYEIELLHGIVSGYNCEHFHFCFM